MSLRQVVQLIRSLPEGAVTFQVLRQYTHPSNNDDTVAALEVIINCDHLIHYNFHGNRYQQLIVTMKQLVML